MIFLLLLSFYVLTRLTRLDLIPVFVDEANYLYWAKIIAETNRGWFITLTAGKPPVFLWLMVPFLKILPAGAYLLAGRLPSVLAGALTLLGVFKLTGLMTGSRRAAYLATVFVVITPFLLFYDRLALYDSLLTAAMVWVGYFTVRAGRTGKIADAVLWGASLGAAFLSKPTAVLYWGLTPAVFLLFYLQTRGKRHWFRAALLILIALALGQGIHHSLIISRGYNDYLNRALDYKPSLAQLLADPFGLWAKNLPDSFKWLWAYLTPPVFLGALVSQVFILWKDRRNGLAVLILWLAPILVLSFFGRTYFPRYFLFTIPFLLLALAQTINLLLGKGGLWRWLTIVITFGLMVLPLKFDLQLLTDPPKAPLPEIESWQYITGYPGSYGFAPIYDYLDQRLAEGPLTLFVQGSFSHFPHAFNLHYWGNKNMQIIERWPLAEIDEAMIVAQGAGRVFLVVRHNRAAGEEDILQKLPLRVLVEGKKPGGADSVFLVALREGGQ